LQSNVGRKTGREETAWGMYTWTGEVAFEGIDWVRVNVALNPRFKVVTAFDVIFDVILCSLVQVYRSFASLMPHQVRRVSGRFTTFRRNVLLPSSG
jgi:hypothetical protein